MQIIWLTNKIIYNTVRIGNHISISNELRNSGLTNKTKLDPATLSEHRFRIQLGKIYFLCRKTVKLEATI